MNFLMLGSDSTQMGTGKYRILVVDDDIGIRKLLCKLLQRDNFAVDEACDGLEALNYIEHKGPYNVVVTDVIMPKLSGIQLLHEMRKENPLIPVIIITGKPALEAAVECMKNGAYDYISKPFDFKQIKNTVDGALKEHLKQVEDSKKEERGEGSSISMLTNRRFFGDYKILQIVGEGNIGIVFLAEKKDGARVRRFALKVLKPTHVNKDVNRKTRERFLKESEVIADIKHENIVSVEDYGLTDKENIPYMIMEYVKGKSLDYYIANNSKMDLRQKAAVVLDIAQALKEIHSHGICHRDIKPHNVIIRHDMQAKVTDFGIAKMPDSDLTMTYELIGSPAYLSPEGFTSSRVDHRADLFSLGILAYELFLGKKPFVAESISRYAHVIQYELPLAPTQIDEDFPVALEELLAKMLKKSPEDRIQNADELIKDLEALLAIEDWTDLIPADHKPSSDWKK